MKKIFFLAIFFILLSLTFAPEFAMAAWTIGDPIVPDCGTGTPTYETDASGNKTCASNCPCGITDFFVLLTNIYSFIVLEIASPLAIIGITIGGILMLISAGNPNLLGLGKKILFAAIIGLVLVFCSYLIISFIMTTLGYTGGEGWATLPE